MLKKSVFIATSLDGFIAREDGNLDWLMSVPSDPAEDYGYRMFMKDVDVIVMGRKTFQKALTFAEWPYKKLKVFVLTSTLARPPEKLADEVEFLNVTPRGAIEGIEERGYKHVYIDGGLTIQRFLTEALIDEITLTRIPVLLGSGIPLFAGLARDIRLVHVTTRVFENGFVQSKYSIPGVDLQSTSS